MGVRIPSHMVIAIYGASEVGKSTIARLLGQRTGLPVRHCGEAVKERAAELNSSLAALSLDVHQMIDAETRSFVARAPSAIVEGRYLDDCARCSDRKSTRLNSSHT